MCLTRQEVFQALADGKEIELSPKTKDKSWLSLENYYNCLKYDIFQFYNWRIKPEPPKWYENIPSHGVLCWVHDTIEYPNSSTSSLAVIRDLSIDGNYMDYLFNEWFYATPLTKEEIKQFLQGE